MQQAACAVMPCVNNNNFQCFPTHRELGMPCIVAGSLYGMLNQSKVKGLPLIGYKDRVITLRAMESAACTSA